jgi:hypothetical protein
MHNFYDTSRQCEEENFTKILWNENITYLGALFEILDLQANIMLPLHM